MLLPLRPVFVPETRERVLWRCLSVSVCSKPFSILSAVRLLCPILMPMLHLHNTPVGQCCYAANAWATLGKFVLFANGLGTWVFGLVLALTVAI